MKRSENKYGSDEESSDGETADDEAPVTEKEKADTLEAYSKMLELLQPGETVTKALKVPVILIHNL